MSVINGGSAAPALPVQRLKGSDLLLHKIPLYARAKAFAESPSDDPTAECNTLGYDGEFYRVYSLLRAAAVECGSEVTSADGRDTGVEGPITNITTPLHSSSLRRTRWDAPATTGGVKVEGEDLYQRMRRARREVELVEGAVVLPLERELLRPTVGTAETHLLLGAASAQQAVEEAQVEKKRHKQRRRKGDPNGARGGGGGDAEPSGSEDDTGADEDDDETAVALGSRELTRLERGLAVNLKRRGYGVNMQLVVTAAPGEKQLVKAARDGAAAAAVEVNGESGQGAQKSFSKATSPGARMMTVLVQRTSSELASGTGEDDARAVKAYLKRVAWLDKQASASQLPLVALSAMEPSWMQLSAAQRVRQEMAHTMRERQRFSRKRARDDTDGGDGDNADDG